MDRWKGKVAVVTGASSGIGAAVAKLLVKNGLQVVGLARRVDRMEQMANELSDTSGKLHAVKCDLSKEEDILSAFNWITENLGPVHILVNNAGFTKPTNLTEGDTEAWRQMLEVNVLAFCICNREAVKIMKQNGIAGHIIHMNSIVGHYVPIMPKPNFNIYPASKYAITALTESLRQELRFFKSNIKITSISPGYVRTEFENNYPDDGTREALSTMPYLHADDIAQAILYVLGTPPHVQVHELTIRPLGESY